MLRCFFCRWFSSSDLLQVAIVGRPNVGKSSLFNRLAKKTCAIVSKVPGTTRDRKEMKVLLSDMEFNLIDTGGLEDSNEHIPKTILEQTKKAVSLADVILFMIDIRVGVTDTDFYFAKWLRKNSQQSSNILVLANKADGPDLTDEMHDCIADAHRLGFGEPIPFSSQHGEGLADLATALIPFYDKKKQLILEEKKKAGDLIGTNQHKDESPPIQVAFFGMC